MMPIRPLAATALVASSVPFAVVAAPARAQSTTESTSNDGLYSPFPATPEAEGIAGEFFATYGRSVPVSELRAGSFPDQRVLTVAPPRARGASERAGVAVAAPAARLGILAAITALVLAGALALMATFGAAPARAALPKDFAGVVAEDVYIGSDAYQRTQFTAIRKVGFTAVRQVFRWAEIQPEADRYDFSATDRFVKAAAVAGIRVQPLLFGEPAWATSRPAGDGQRATFPPRNPATFAAFAGTIAARYGANGTFWRQNPFLKANPITAYQLWNEPNLPLYWGMRPDAAGYAAMLRAATPAIKAVQPGALVISAGIPDSKLGIRARPYLRSMLKFGAGRHMDAVGIHPYSISVNSVMKLTKSARRTLDSLGGKKIGLVITEIGWAVGGPKTKGRTVSSKSQAKLVPAVYLALAKQRKGLKLKSVVYFAWRDSPTYFGRSDFWGLRTGLFKLDGQPKPVVKSLKRGLKGLKKLR